MTAERLLRLLSLLTVRRSWGGDELARRLGVTPRTIRRDVERLRGLGYEVRAVPGPAGGYELGAGTGLPPLLLDDDAAAAVALGLRAVAGGAVAGMEEAAARAAAVIERVLPARIRRRVDALRSAVVPVHAPRPGDQAVRPETLALLALACRDGERLRFGCTDGHGRQSRRHAEPYRLAFTARHWYLVARDVDKGDWRSFRVDRLAEAADGGESAAAGRRGPPAVDSPWPVPRRGATDAVMIVNANGVELYVETHGDGVPVLLLHGWPDSSALWRSQVPVLAARGFRVITPDLRGFGRSSRPDGRDAYQLRNSVADVAAILDATGAQEAHVVGHDWGAAVAWLTAMYLPDRVRTLTALSVPHPLAPMTRRQREMAWYQLFFQFEEIAEATLRHEDWAAFRDLASGYADIDRAIADLSRPGALTASLNWYRANLAPRMPGPRPALPPVTAPTLGVWSDGDRYLDGARMRASGELVKGPWRYAEIAGASHWIPLDAPDQLSDLLIGWLT